MIICVINCGGPMTFFFTLLCLLFTVRARIACLHLLRYPQRHEQGHQEGSSFSLVTVLYTNHSCKTLLTLCLFALSLIIIPYTIHILPTSHWRYKKVIIFFASFSCDAVIRVSYPKSFQEIQLITCLSYKTILHRSIS